MKLPKGAKRYGSRIALPDGSWKPLVKKIPLKGKKGGYLRVRCGDCDNKIDIYYPDTIVPLMEIGGVLANLPEWRAILLPMLRQSKRRSAL